MRSDHYERFAHQPSYCYAPCTMLSAFEKLLSVGLLAFGMICSGCLVNADEVDAESAEQSLGIDTNIKDEEVDRSGFLDSGPSDANKTGEQPKQADNEDGWWSYDTPPSIARSGK